MANHWHTLKNNTAKFLRDRYWLTIIAGAGLVSLLLFATGPAPEAEQPEEKTWPVSVLTANPSALQPSFRAYGRVESRNLAHLSADLFAVIKTIHIKEGDQVAAGDVLVELDDGELALDVLARQAELTERTANVRSIESELQHLKATDSEHRSMLKVAQAKLARHRELLGNRLISNSLFDEVLRQTNEVQIRYQDHSQRLSDLPNRLQAAIALRDRAQAALARAKLTAGKTRLAAPFDGIVLSVPAALGARAQPGTTLVSIADSNAYEVRVPVPPVYSTQFSAPTDALDPAKSQISAKLTNGTTLTFSRLAGAVQSGQTSADALFAWQLEQGQPAPVGATVELQVELPFAEQVVALPAQALYENERVYVVEQQRLRPVRVQRIGERHTASDGFQILVRAAELVRGSQIITTQLPKAMAGLKVATIESGPESIADSAAPALAREAAQLVREKQDQIREAVLEPMTPAEISLLKEKAAPSKATERRSSLLYGMS